MFDRICFVLCLLLCGSALAENKKPMYLFPDAKICAEVYAYGQALADNYLKNTDHGTLPVIERMFVIHVAKHGAAAAGTAASNQQVAILFLKEYYAVLEANAQREHQASAQGASVRAAGTTMDLCNNTPRFETTILTTLPQSPTVSK